MIALPLSSNGHRDCADFHTEEQAILDSLK